MKKTLYLLDDFLEEGVFPGYSVAFLSQNTVQTIYKGYHTPHRKQAIAKGDVYDLASLTKALVTGNLLLLLLEQKPDILDHFVSDYLPEMTEKDLTLRHLVTHTSGLEGYIPNRDQLSPNELIHALCHLTCGKTKEQVFYTDTGFVLLGKVLEKLFDEPIAKSFERLIAHPLDLDQVGYQNTPFQSIVPTIYLPDEKRYLQGQVHDPKARTLQEHCGSAGLFGSLDNLVRIIQCYFNDGMYQGNQIWKKASIQSLLSDFSPSGHAGRSLAWDLQVYKGEVWLRHTGFTGTAIVFNLRQKQAMIFLSNRLATGILTPVFNQKRDQLLQTYIQEAFDDM